MPRHGANNKPKNQTVMMGRDLARKVRAIAEHDGLTIPEVLERYARACIMRRYRRVIDKQRHELGGEGG